jgi:Zn-dependent M28 family amino/carboxypeptidase
MQISKQLFTVVMCLVVLNLTACQVPVSEPLAVPTATPMPKLFSGETAFEHIENQVDLNPRAVGTAGHEKLRAYILENLQAAGWQTEVQEFVVNGHNAYNLIGKLAVGRGQPVLLGAHYDARLKADNDPDLTKREQPYPAANDGGSGVAVLLELARTLDAEKLQDEVWLVFFDAEDNGNIDGWDWILGSGYMAEKLTIQPKVVIVVDMVGDADQQLYLEQSSTTTWRDEIWAIAAELGYSQWFITEPRWNMTDDHTPFLRKGIPAVNIIDFDYPHWHTTADTPDKVSGDSLERVGRVLEVLLEEARQP